MKRLTGKRGKIYRQLLKEGKTKAYARRISKGLAEGKSVKEARGYHKAERYLKRGTVYKPAPKGRLEKKKEEWACYAYNDMLAVSDDMISPFSMSSYDHTKTLFKNYRNQGQDELFAIHQYMERQITHYLEFFLEPASIDDIFVDTCEDIRYRHRQFEWKLFDEDGELRYWLVYQKGEIIKRQMWEDFDFVEFKLEIRELKIWE